MNKNARNAYGWMFIFTLLLIVEFTPDRMRAFQTVTSLDSARGMTLSSKIDTVTSRLNQIQKRSGDMDSTQFYTNRVDSLTLRVVELAKEKDMSETDKQNRIQKLEAEINQLKILADSARLREQEILVLNKELAEHSKTLSFVQSYVVKDAAQRKQIDSIAKMTGDQELQG